MSLVAYQSSSEESDDEPQITKTSAESIASVHVKRKEPVKIAVPSLDEFDVESEGPTKKPKMKASSGLLSLLPAPRYTAHSTTTLVPASVKRKEAENKNLPNVLTPSSSTLRRVDELFVKKSFSEMPLGKELIQNPKEDVLPSGFFSLDSKPADSGVSDFFSLSGNSTPTSSDIKDKLSSPRSFNNISSLQDYESPISHEAGNSTFVSTAECQPHEYVTDTSYNVHSSSSWSSNVSSDDIADESTPDVAPTEDTSTNIMNDERFRRLQGKRRKDFDDLDIIDVNVDSQLSDKSQWLTKSITEEKKVSFSRKKGELPTQQQRRKHQITYLAFQAKERELDLKNQWAQNRLTKRETQSKYGF